MKRILGTILTFLFLGIGLGTPAKAQVNLLDSLALLNVDSTPFRIGTLADKKAVVLVFTGNHCVYSKKYEDRLIALAQNYAPKAVAFVLINSNSPELSQDDRFALMQARAKEKSYPYPYLHDPEAKLAKAVGATKNPEAFVAVRKDNAWVVVYSGKIDDNPLMETRVEHYYLKEALDAILSGQAPATAAQPALGCNIKQ